jgi:hypothetical protein
MIQVPTQTVVLELEALPIAASPSDPTSSSRDAEETDVRTDPPLP